LNQRKPVDGLTEKEAREELAWLAGTLERANEAYHAKDAPEISNAECDRLKTRNMEV